MIEYSADRAELMAAIDAVQQKAGPLTKDAWNDYGKYSYTKLGDIIANLAELLKEHNLTVTHFNIGVEEGLLKLFSEIYHTPTGQWLRNIAYYPVGPIKGQTDQQMISTTVTYGRKNFYLAVFRLITEDNDASHSPQGGNERRQQRPPKQQKRSQHRPQQPAKPVDTVAAPAPQPTGQRSITWSKKDLDYIRANVQRFSEASNGDVVKALANEAPPENETELAALVKKLNA